MLLLAFDTATPAVTVALHDGAAVVTAELAVDARRHGELLAPAIARVLATAGAAAGDLTGIAVGTGPGPYTGLRAGLVTARALGDALGAARARRVHHGHHRVRGGRQPARCPAAASRWPPTPGARRSTGPGTRPAAAGCTAREVGPPGDAADGGPVAGEGPWLYPAELGPPAGPRYPSAAALAALVAGRLAAGGELLPPEPLYLRRPDARVPGPPKRVTP